MARSSRFLWERRDETVQEHCGLQVQVGSDRKLSISSQRTRSLVKKSVTERSPWDKFAASICKFDIRARSPCAKRFLRSFQISKAWSIHIMLSRMEGETEWTSHDTTMLLQRNHAGYEACVVAGWGAKPRTNSTLFFVESAVITERL